MRFFFQSLIEKGIVQEVRFLTGGYQGIVIYCRMLNGKEVVCKIYLEQFQSIQEEYQMYHQLSSIDVNVPHCLYFSIATFISWMMISYVVGKNLSSFSIVQHDFVAIGRELGHLSHLNGSLYGKGINGIYDNFRQSFSFLLYDDVILSDILIFSNSDINLGQFKDFLDVSISYIEYDLQGKYPTLCHGDCSPDNIMIDQNGKIIFIDPQPIGSHYFYDISFFIQRYMIQGESWIVIEGIIQKLLLGYQETCACEVDKKSLYAMLMIVMVRKMFVYYKHNPNKEKKIHKLFAYLKDIMNLLISPLSL